MAPPDLYTIIENELIHSKFSQKRFLPDAKFKELFTWPIIEQELRSQDSQSTNPDLVKYIVDNATRVFAILVYSGLVAKAFTLSKHTFMDKYLPIQVDGKAVTTFHLLADNPALEWFEDWTSRERGTFKNFQWAFMAPVFDKCSILEQPDDEIPLPFVTYDDTPDEGSFGKIHKAQIHGDHIKDFQLDKNLTVAIKELRVGNISDRAYEVEMDALELARWLEDDHLVKFIAGFEVGGRHYLMFQWVDGGNLRRFWQQYQWSFDDDLIIWALEQMKGIVNGLERLHSFDPQKNCRHGDLKPENILVLTKPGEKRVLQIADMGSAKIHSSPTNLRQVGTMSLAGTLRYQPPEVQTSISNKRSRAYDIWSMGCILLEFIIWVLYGSEGLFEFAESFVSTATQPFFLVNQEQGTLQPNVDAWIEHLRKTCLSDSDDGCVSPALRDLLTLVRTQILVENDELESDEGPNNIKTQNITSHGVPQVLITRATTRKNQGKQQRRANVSDVKAELIRICSEGRFHNKDVGREIPRPILKAETLKRNLNLQSNRSTLQIGRPRQQVADPELSDTWEICNDNLFVRNYFRTLTSMSMENDFPSTQEDHTTNLCDNCRKIFLNDFSFTLANSDRRCGLCQVLYPYLELYAKDLNGNTSQNAKLVRIGSSLATASTALPILSIVISPGYSSAPSYIHRGFPTLPKSPSETQTRLLKHWLDDCDNKHGEACQKPDPPTTMRRPTRLIDVSSYPLKLDCNPENRPKDYRYVILSHPWGDSATHPPFCTTNSNIESMKSSINYDELPRNFQDAVTVARGLHIDYLWIDSLCIIQKDNGDKGDFEAESKFMEDYYSGAYCTIAATSADGSSSGFLGERSARQCHRFQLQNESPQSTFYICENIDHFTRDVETSYLSRRGWVFQERALSRRTIHFTNTQVYWECGHGVRCETMSRLFNRKSSFLSDPNFPKSASEYYKGMRIEFFQYIYSRYSTLDFSHETDRSVAMFGLEKRLARVYEVPARYGVLGKSFLHRSLLWKAGDVKIPLRRIDSGDGNKVPSWSWMAVMGPIKYMDAPFDMMQWNLNIGSPFTGAPTSIDGLWIQPVSDLVAPAKKVDQSVDPNDLIYDRLEYKDDDSIQEKLRCVVIGFEKVVNKDEPSELYTLLVIPTGSSEGATEYDDYERIGVARLKRDDIDWKKCDILVRIV
ncbi:hypothetical protein GGR53DRAFT_527218 [Hypoxylon sp. FL1150]|nr:hypothetical protein GGR53DRAFT_527218 [Hypoxylon sp. FL1150]